MELQSQLSAVKVPRADGRADSQDEVRGLQERLAQRDQEIASNRSDFDRSLSTAR